MDISKPPMYTTKKWTIVVMCTLNIVTLIIYACLANYLADQYLNKYEDINIHNTEDAKTWVIIVIITLSVLGIIFSLFGLVGAIMENYCLMVTYAVLCVLGFIGNLANSIKRPYYWFNAVWSFLITIVVILFIIDLRGIRRRQLQLQQNC